MNIGQILLHKKLVVNNCAEGAHFIKSHNLRYVTYMRVKILFCWGKNGPILNHKFTGGLQGKCILLRDRFTAFTELPTPFAQNSVKDSWAALMGTAVISVCLRLLAKC